MFSVTPLAKQLWLPIQDRLQRSWRWLRRKLRIVLVAVITIAVIVALLIAFAFWGRTIWSGGVEVWRWYRGTKTPNEAMAPIFTLAAGLAVAGVTLMRHFAQTEADRQRRITESFSKAVEQLAHKDIEVRLGGIYTLERISKESRDDYWTIMETLTAFVRERARWREPDAGASETMVRFYEDNRTDPKKRPSTDIAAVLAIIVRRPKKERNRERRQGWQFNLQGVDLRVADLSFAHLEGADLGYANLEFATLSDAHLERADLSFAHLEGADLSFAHLERAYLLMAYLEGADLRYANLEGATLIAAHLEGADLRGAAGLTQDQIDEAYGDANTKLPEGLRRPEGWR